MSLDFYFNQAVKKSINLVFISLLIMNQFLELAMIFFEHKVKFLPIISDNDFSYLKVLIQFSIFSQK